MKQLVILSGKGGTGKTSLTAAFAPLANGASAEISAVFVDADVDAANLSLILQPDQSVTAEFWGGSLAEIDPELCTGCGACVRVCNFDAILPDFANPLINRVDPVACDGCAACMYACANQAVRMIQQQEGNWFHSNTDYGPLFHAELFPGKENSGKLVSLVKQNARLWAEDHQIPLVILDGPPGIGCPVISACAGADLGLIAAEPSLAGIHDLKRILGTLNHFKVPAVICINKHDIYPEGASLIREFSAENGVEVIGEIPYDPHILTAMLCGQPVTRLFPGSPSSKAIYAIWNRVFSQLSN